MCNTGIKNSGGTILKIAAVSDNGTTVSQHFGRATLYVVMTVENGKIVAKEVRERGGNTCACHHGSSSEESCHDEHRHDTPQSQTLHTSMADAISDCKVIIARGMGYGAYASLKSNKLEPIITDVADIEQAVKMYIDGKLVNYMEQLH
jgi:predicted Fe-Mo cluster-binding NifX family protein